LHHTNIVPVFGAGEADGQHFYAMQFIAGHPLDAVIEEVRRLKEKSGARGRRTRWPTPTRKASCIATSSRPTYSWTSRAPSG
jgi:serine/threonine protein kinase